MNIQQPPSQLGMDEHIFHQPENKILMTCLTVAVLFHAVFFLIRWPELEVVSPREDLITLPTITWTKLPPPERQVREAVLEEIEIRAPLPDPTPREPEPIREPAAEIVLEPMDLNLPFTIGDSEPPPPRGPLIPGVEGVTNPILLRGSKTAPEYPEHARVARLTANLVLQAIVYKDGTVGEVVVLRSSRPNLGFEEKAIEAILQWRYKPATQDGKPVDVYFTIQVAFNLN